MRLPLLDLLPCPPPRLALGTFPSPVEEHSVLARAFGVQSLLVKRDDLNGIPFGGNKLRALEWILPAAGPSILTMGGYGSTWCAALAVASRAAGRHVTAALFPQPWSDTVAGVLARTLEHGEVRLASSRPMFPFAIGGAWRAARNHGRVTWLPAGGATPLGVLGSVNAALEFVAQQGGAEPAQAIVVPLGSGGTAAGLLLGMWLAGWPVKICAVRVTDPWFANRRRVMSLVERTASLLRRSGLSVRSRAATLRVIGDQLGPGYGYPTPQAFLARDRFEEAGISVDLTYGAKACAALGQLASSFRHLCLWHTFDARLASRPESEHFLLHEARRHAETLWPLPKSI